MPFPRNKTLDWTGIVSPVAYWENRPVQSVKWAVSIRAISKCLHCDLTNYPVRNSHFKKQMEFEEIEDSLFLMSGTSIG